MRIRMMMRKGAKAEESRMTVRRRVRMMGRGGGKGKGGGV